MGRKASLWKVMSSGPQVIALGNRDRSIAPIVVFMVGDQAWIGPRTVEAQSISIIRLPVSPPPSRKAACSAATDVWQLREFGNRFVSPGPGGSVRGRRSADSDLDPHRSPDKITVILRRSMHISPVCFLCVSCPLAYGAGSKGSST